MNRWFLFLNPGIIIICYFLHSTAQIIHQIPSLKALSAHAIVDQNVIVHKDTVNQDLHDYLLFFKKNNNDPTKMLFQSIKEGYSKDLIKDVLRLKPDLQMTQTKISKKGKSYQYTPLICAIQKKRDDIVRRLLNAGSDPEQCSSDGKKPIFHALKTNRQNIVEPLVNRKIDFTVSFDCFTVMTFAIIWCPELIPFLVTSGASVDSTIYLNKTTSLMYIVNQICTYKTHERLGRFKTVLSCKPSVNHVDSLGRTALFYALENNKDEPLVMARDLIAAQANINVSDNTGKTPLIAAIESDNNHAVQLLLQHHADIEQADHYQLTALDYAEQLGNNNIITALLKSYINRNDIQNKSQAIDSAFRKGFLEIGKKLLTPQTINHSGKHGWTPLHYAVFWNDLETVNQLIEQHAQVNKIDQHGCTPLMYAAKNGYTDIAKLLIDHHANVLLQDEVNFTALDYARKHNNQAIVGLLEPIVDEAEESEWVSID